MSILVDTSTRLMVQGITGRDGSFHTRAMLEYGTRVVAGVSPGKGGERVFDVPVFNSAYEAVKHTGANTSVIFVPAAFAADALWEASFSGVHTVVCITEGIPVQDMIKIYHHYRSKGIRLIGPNCPGVISPELAKVGILPASIFKKGRVGVISRSGTLTYEVVYHITKIGLGESTCVGIGGDQIVGTSFVDLLELFKQDPETEAVVLIGEIGGRDEEEAGEYIVSNFNKPVVAFIAGMTAPKGKRMGHAGAIITGGEGTAREKADYLRKLGIPVAETPGEVARILKGIIQGRGQ